MGPDPNAELSLDSLYSGQGLTAPVGHVDVPALKILSCPVLLQDSWLWPGR